MPPKRASLDGSPLDTKRIRTNTSNLPDATTYVAKAVSTAYTFVQEKTCQNLPKSLPERCVSCIEKQAIVGSCRFIGLRVFTADPRTSTPEVAADYAFRSNQTVSKGQDEFVKRVREARGPGAKARRGFDGGRKPNRKRSSGTSISPEPGANAASGGRSERAAVLEQITADRREMEAAAEAELADWDLTPVPPTVEDAEYVLPRIAPLFAFHLRREIRHERTHLNVPDIQDPVPHAPRPVIRIRNVADTRSTCDVCATSIFMGSYMCGCCGREFCLGCWEEWTPSAQRNGRRLHRPDHCSRHRRHLPEAMIFVTRAQPGELAELERRVRLVMKRHPPEEVMHTDDDDRLVEALPVVRAEYPTDDLTFLPTPKVAYADTSISTFKALWRKGGIPLVLTGMRERFKLAWDDAYFTAHFGSEQCGVHDYFTDDVTAARVSDFFESFSASITANDFESGVAAASWKLKDWPASADFAETFPLLFRDFEQAVPFPQYTSRTSPLNLARYFPNDTLKPDLGPKMYNAYPAPDFIAIPPNYPEDRRKLRLEKIRGTTNLHLDLTDAVNIMLYAAGGDDAPVESTVGKNIPHCGAIWDIFPPSSATVLRDYLKPNSPADDPIHRQLHYLGENDLKTLHGQGIKSYRIFQNPGEAVFIPAGCPHQVRNRMSCVKVAVDFVSPEHVGVCWALVEEARRMAGVWAGNARSTLKDDVLQLWCCLAFSWQALEAVTENTFEVGNGYGFMGAHNGYFSLGDSLNSHNSQTPPLPRIEDLLPHPHSNGLSCGTLNGFATSDNSQPHEPSIEENLAPPLSSLARPQLSAEDYANIDPSLRDEGIGELNTTANTAVLLGVTNGSGARTPSAPVPFSPPAVTVQEETVVPLQPSELPAVPQMVQTPVVQEDIPVVKKETTLSAPPPEPPVLSNTFPEPSAAQKETPLLPPPPAVQPASTQPVAVKAEASPLKLSAKDAVKTEVAPPSKAPIETKTNTGTKSGKRGRPRKVVTKAVTKTVTKAGANVAANAVGTKRFKIQVEIEAPKIERAEYINFG